MNGSSENLTFSEEFKCSIFLPYSEEKQRSWRYNFGLKKKKKKTHVCARKYRAMAGRNNNMNIWKLKHGSQNSKSEINLHIGGFRATCHEQRQSKLSFNSFSIIYVRNTELKIFITFDMTYLPVNRFSKHQRYENETGENLLTSIRLAVSGIRGFWY